MLGIKKSQRLKIIVQCTKLILHEAYYLRHLSNFCFDTKAKIALDIVVLIVSCAKQQGAKLKWQW